MALLQHRGSPDRTATNVAPAAAASTPATEINVQDASMQSASMTGIADPPSVEAGTQEAGRPRDAIGTPARPKRLPGHPPKPKKKQKR